MGRVLIIGGYGNFGRFIAQYLAKQANLTLILVGRNEKKAKKLASSLKGPAQVEMAYVDINKNLDQALSALVPDIVIHTSGPFQVQDYHVAELCIKHGCHYIDLADARDFVNQIDCLDQRAKEKGVLVCSGASSVPALTAAIIDQFIAEFEHLDCIDYGIATAQKTNQGLATTKAVLSYAGKPFYTLKLGERKRIFGWLGARKRQFWLLNTRIMGNCDIPDLDLFQQRYTSLKTIRFQAALELKALQFILMLCSLLVKIKIVSTLEPLAAWLLKISRWFDVFGTDNSGFFMDLTGTDAKGVNKKVSFEIAAFNGDGLYIPCVPAIILVQKLITGKMKPSTVKGAQPCLGLISLEEYLSVLKQLKISWRSVGSVNDALFYREK